MGLQISSPGGVLIIINGKLIFIIQLQVNACS